MNKTLHLAVTLPSWQDALGLGRAASLFVAMQSHTQPQRDTPVSVALTLPDGSMVALGGSVARTVALERSRSPGTLAGFSVVFEETHGPAIRLLQSVAMASVGANATRRAGPIMVALAARLTTGAGIELHTEAHYLHEDDEHEPSERDVGCNGNGNGDDGDGIDIDIDDDESPTSSSPSTAVGCLRAGT